MAILGRSFQVVRASVKSYGEESPKWTIKQTEEALRCWDFQDFIDIGVVLFEAVTDFDESYRARVLAGDEEWSQEVHDAVLETYKILDSACSHLIKELKFFESRYGQFKHADKFRSYCREVKGILCNDAEFFSGDDLVSLRDEAIDIHNKGETIEYRQGE